MSDLPEFPVSPGMTMPAGGISGKLSFAGPSDHAGIETASLCTARFAE